MVVRHRRGNQFQCRGFANRYQRGASLIAWLLMITASIVVSLILVVGFYEGRKSYWDWKVKELCAKDGGVRIFERIAISKEQANSMPKVNDFLGLTPEVLAKPSAPAYLVMRSVVLREGDPTVIRHENQIVRRSDRRIVGQAVQ